jgi:hypothetical protein
LESEEKMDNKARFMRAISRFQNFRSHLETKCKLLEKAFGSDTSIFDFDGLEELFQAIVDMSCLMFPNLTEDEIAENISWNVYEAVDMDNPTVQDGDKEFIVNSVEALYDMIAYFNEKSGDDKK